MDARPQRPLRSLHIQGDENADSKQTLHQRHKSTGTLSTMLHVGGLKVAAKRTAFGDVSNTSKNIIAVRDDLATIGKNNIHEIIQKPAPLQAQPQEKSAGFLRPAQRPLTVAGLKGLLSTQTNNSVSQPSSTISIATKASSDVQQVQPQILKPRALSKRATSIYKDDVSETEPPSSAVVEVATTNSAPIAPVHQTLGPRQHKSQPQLKADQPVLRRTQSKYIGYVEDLQKEPTTVPTIPQVVSAQQVDTQIEDHIAALDKVDTSYVGFQLHSEENVHEKVVASMIREDNHEHLPPLPLASEPEEYWEEEEEEEIYDEQGYTTAHSYRSRGENTTGGATTVIFPKVTSKVKQELAIAKDIVENSRTAEEIEDEAWDTSMVAEYGDEIFSYMRELEIKMLPNPHYMDNQGEIQWSMRSVLMDWLIQVHCRFSLLPETLFLCVNYIDRFLSCKIVSLGKLQLVGATAIFVAAKYEEINCPSVAEIVYMVDGGYTGDEILKAERFMLSMLQFELGWPGPMSFLRRISKADDYDLETRTLAKYFLEVTIMDERFVGSPPSFVAAGAHCLARMMLKKGDEGVWTTAHVYYSGYTWTQLRPFVALVLECCDNPLKHHSAVYEKYSDRRYKRASHYVQGELNSGFRLPTPRGSSFRPLLPFEDVAMPFDSRDSFKRMIQIKG